MRLRAIEAILIRGLNVTKAHRDKVSQETDVFYDDTETQVSRCANIPLRTRE